MVYKWYILQSGGLYATYHLLGEPETTIEIPPPNKEFFCLWAPVFFQGQPNERHVFGEQYQFNLELIVLGNFLKESSQCLD